MSTDNAASFTAGLVQMRSGLSPQANLDAAVRLIGEAKSAGADYVQTPEMTNILESSRERLFAAIVPEEQDASLATFRELARALGITIHVGSLAIKASADKAVNRSFLIDRRGEIVARIAGRSGEARLARVLDPLVKEPARRKPPARLQ